jgi:hypothetical protein
MNWCVQLSLGDEVDLNDCDRYCELRYLRCLGGGK